MMKMAGPKPKITVVSQLPLWMGSALISTLWSIKNCSKPGPTNTGSVLSKVVDVRGGWACAPALAGASVVAVGQVTALTKRPSMRSPWL